MTNDIFEYISKFFNIYLKNEINASNKTIESYKDVFKLIFIFINKKCPYKIKDFSFKYFTRDFVLNFLNWLEEERKNGITTRNNRLTIIKSFVSYIIQFEFDNIELIQILKIPRKKEIKRKVTALSEEQVKIFLEQPNTRIKKGRRELAMLSLLYDSGIRISELLNLKVKDIIFESIIKVEIWHGKGNKHRTVPISDDVANILKIYINDYNKNNIEEYLFSNSRSEILTSNAIRKIINKYAKKAKEIDDTFPGKIHPHLFRHSKATHLINKGVTLIEVKEFLGHENLETVEIYITTDIMKKKEALETIEHKIIFNDDQVKNNNLIEELINNIGI